MKNNCIKFSLLPLLALLCGCGPVGAKAASISVIYAAAAVTSGLLLVGYCVVEKNRSPWYLLLFSSVLVVNIGYFALGVSQDLASALLANRLAYLGSVLLPLAMFMIILNVTHIAHKKWLPWLLLGIGLVVFLIAASPGYLNIYYQDVELVQVNGLSSLKKTYGPLHFIYMLYLFGYFAAMVATIVHATVKDKIDSLAYAVILAIAVFVNIGVWLIEQLVQIDFEILSISYIISESFLLGLHLLMAETERRKSLVPAPAPAAPDTPQPDPAQLDAFMAGLSELTPKEQAICRCYVEGMTTTQVMEQLNIKENTLKFHNKNLYSKLGVSSRKQLLALYRQYSTGQDPAT